jgi:hypothetical protein
MTEFVVRMDNRPGRLATLTEALADAGVNIEALAAFGANGDGVIRLIVDDARRARRAFGEAGLSVEEHEVLTALVPNAPGQLAAVARRLANSDINIEAVYVLGSSLDGLELALVVDQPLSAMPHLPVRGSLDVA